MATTLDLVGARRMLLDREELLASGRTERELHSLVASGEIVRVRRGRYVDGADWRGLWNEGRHLLRVVAFHANSSGDGPVFCGPSAAALHGLPLYRFAPPDVHVLIRTRRHGRRRAGAILHSSRIPEADIVDVDGIRCTSLDRTVLDVACTTAPETGVSIADAALRREAVIGQTQDAERHRAWHQRMKARGACTSIRGIRRARSVIAFADGRAQLPGESVSRLHLYRLGYRNIDLQVPVVGSAGNPYWMDFAFPGAQVFGEFDGRDKYVDLALTGGRSAEDVVLAEKRREDDVRGVTGWRTIRWGSEHLVTADVLSARLRAFGLRPPG